MNKQLLGTLLSITALTVLMAAKAQASVKGDSISIKFGADQPSPDGSHLPATAVAGVPEVASANWNNAESASGSLDNLVRDTLGVPMATSASVIWAATNTWSGGSNDHFLGDDHTLMLGYLDQNTDSTQIIVRISDLPDAFATYDVYVYFLGDNVHRGGVYTVNGTAKFGFVGAEDSGPDFVDAGLVVPPAKGNYLVFRGLSGSMVNISADNDIDSRSPINAIEVVNTTR